VASSRSILWVLLGGAIGLGGILQGLHWKNSSRSADFSELENRLRMAREENDILKRENESLRSLAQGGGELAIPQELITRIEKELGLRFTSSPVVHRIAGEELRDRIGASIESRYGSFGVDYRQEAYGLIGWTKTDDNLLALLTAVRAVGARGWFDDVTGDAWVTDRFEIKNIPDQAILVRLLSRILLHQHFPTPPAYPGDDAARAREAFHQGVAAGAESRFYAANARAISFMPMKQDPEAELLFNSLPPFIQGISTFSAIDGKRLMDALFVQSAEKFEEGLRNPPQTSRAVFLPGSPTAAPAPLEMPKTEEPFLSETAGQLGLRLWLEPLDLEEALTISSAWQNDRYVLVPDGEESSAVIWDIELETPEAADALQEAALKIVSAMAGVEEQAKLDAEVRLPVNRVLKVSRPASNRVRYSNHSNKAP